MASDREKQAAEQGRIGMLPSAPVENHQAQSYILAPKMQSPIPPGACSQHRMLNCTECNENADNDAEADDSATDDAAFDNNQVPRLVFEDKQLTEEELKELQKQQPNAIICQALVPLQTIAQQFELFINDLAQQQGLTYQEFMQQNPGFQCQQNGNVLEITFPDQEHMHDFIHRLQQNNMINIPKQFQQANDAANPLSTHPLHQQPKPQQQNTQEEAQQQPSSFNPTPFSTRATMLPTD